MAGQNYGRRKVMINKLRQRSKKKCGGQWYWYALVHISGTQTHGVTKQTAK